MCRKELFLFWVGVPSTSGDKRREGAAHNARIDFRAEIAAPALNKAIELTEFNSR